jgi:hypothetical protein
MRTTIALAVLGCALACGVPAVHAEERRAQDDAKGTVVRIDDGELLVDLSADRVGDGTELEVYRAVRVRHPVTGKDLEDRFVIGRVKIVQAGGTLSLAKPVGEPSRPFEVGDAVEGERPAAPRPATADGPGDADPETRAVLEAWRQTLGRSPAERVDVYQRFVEAHPESRFVPFVTRELRVLAGLVRESQAAMAVEKRRAMAASRLVDSVRAQPVRRAREGQRAAVAVAADPNGPVRSLLLYVRPAREDAAYERVPMERDRNGHARVDVPPELVVPPAFEYFVVAVDAQGRAEPVLGASEAPVRAVVEALHPTPSEGQRSRVRLSTEVVSFDGSSGDDVMVVTEGDFLYRTLFGALYGVRVGYGHFRGRGAPLEVLDAGGAPEVAAFTYGFFELELRLHRLFAVMARTTVGLGQLEREDLDQSGLRGGFQGRIRIGPERGTHLVVAGETIPEIGQRAFLGLRWEAIEHWPMAAEVHVTDQPVASGDLAVRGVLEVGRRFADVAALSARLSFQGRRIDHSGFGAGLAATFDW